MNREITIGRGAQNHLVIREPSISSKHCSVRELSEGTFLIEDLDSSNGTFLNGKRVRQTLIKPGDHLLLAAFELEVGLVLELLNEEHLKTGVIYDEYRKQQNIYAEFAKLKSVYDDYQKMKRKIMQTNNLKSTGIKAGLSVIPFVGSALGILSGTLTGNVQADMMELEEEFKKKYVCPGCFKFLGAEPFENMERRGFSLVCKTKWIK